MKLHLATSRSSQRCAGHHRPAGATFSGHLTPAIRRSQLVRVVCAAKARPTEPDEDELAYSGMDYYNIEKANVYANLDDEDWPNKVTDWWEYWNYGRWEEEVEDLDDSDDAKPMLDSRRAAERHMRKLLKFMEETSSNREEVVSIAPIPMTDDRSDAYHDLEPETPDRTQLYANVNENDLRAISEKRRWEALMAGRVEREVTRPRVRELKWWKDMRLRRDDGTYELPPQTWSHEDIMKLITRDGKSVHPNKIPHHVKNPYVNADWSNEYGVTYVEETEELLQRLGHWGAPDTRGYLRHQLVVSNEELEDLTPPEEEMEYVDEAEDELDSYVDDE